MNTRVIRHRMRVASLSTEVDQIIQDLRTSAPNLPPNERKAINLLRCASSSMKHADEELGKSA